MRLKLTIVLLVVVVAGCASHRPSVDTQTPVRTQPAIAEQPAGLPSKPIPSKPKPPVVISRAEPSAAVKQVIAQAASARENGRYDYALMLLDRAQRMSPKAGEVYLEMARVNRQLGQLAKAEQLCLKAISLSGPDQRFRRLAKRELAFVRRARNS